MVTVRSNSLTGIYPETHPAGGSFGFRFTKDASRRNRLLLGDQSRALNMLHTTCDAFLPW